MKFNKTSLFKLIIIYYWLLNYYAGYVGNVGRFSALYFLFILPIAAFILIYSHFIIRLKYDRRSIALVLLVVITSLISLIRFDLSTLISVNLFLVTLITIVNSRVSISYTFINKLFIFSILGCIISYHLGINEFGYFPKFGSSNLMIYGGIGWRISLFPLLPESAFLCLLVIVANYFYNTNKFSRLAFYSLAGYFLLFSGLRSSIILLGFFIIFIVFTYFFKFRDRLIYANFNTVLIIFLVLILTFQSFLFYLNQFDNQFINQLLFKYSEGIISKEHLYNTISRAWLWEKHFEVFRESPLFGVGTFDLQNYIKDSSLAYQKTTGSESFLTYLFARIGLAAVLLVAFFYSLQKKALIEKNGGTYFMVLSLMIIMITYGSFIVPYNFIFLLYFGFINNDTKKWN